MMEQGRLNTMPRTLATLVLWLVVSPAGAVWLPISDEFDVPGTLANWTRVEQAEGWNTDQLQVWNINTAQPGRMVMKPYAVTWYQDYRGPLAFKSVSGNFSITTHVEVRNANDQSQTPTASYSLAGPMLRAPRNITDPATQWMAGGEDYVFLSLGFGHGGISSGPQFEVKTTNNSNSVLELTPAPALTATIQLARLTNNVGTFVIAALQAPNAEWQIHRRYRRDDLAGTLQAGLVTYSDYATAATITPFQHNGTALTPGNPLLNGAVPHPDLTAGFDYARFYDLGTLPAALVNANLLDTTAVPNSALLQLLAPGPAPPTGDYNRDFVVDAADYVAWRAAMTNGNLNADGDQNGVINTADYNVWRAHFGATASGAALASSTVPEPGLTTFLVTMAATISHAARRRRTRS
jgi:hypothetical protein